MKVNKVKRAIFAAFAVVFAFVAPIFAANVAKIGDVEYATIDAAYDAAQAGETINLLSDVTLTGKLTITKAITIDGDGHSIIADHTAFLLETSSDCEIKNVTLDTNNKAKGVKIASGNVVFDTVTIPNSNKSDAITVIGNLVIKNYFKVESTYQVFDARSGSVQVEEGAVFDFTSRIGSVSPSDDDLTGAVDANGNPYFCAYGSTTYYKTLYSVLTTITDLTLLDDVALNSNLSVKGTLNLNDKTLTIADGKTLKTGGNLEIVGGTFAGPILLTNASHTLIAPEGIEVTTSVAGSRVVYKDGSYTVVEINYVAQIGETKYETIAEAIAAATTGDTVTLIDDAIVDNAVTIPEGKEITLDLNGNDIVGKMNCIVNNGILVIKDTVGTANVYTTDVSAQGRAAILNNATGTLTIFGGWFGDSNNDMTDRNALNRGNALKNYGMVTVKGGYFTNVSNQYISNEAYAYAINTLVGGTTVIDNATVYGDINGLIYSAGTTVVNGGSFTLGRPNEENNLWYLAYGNVEIKGGVWTRAFKVPSWNTGDPKFEGNVVVSGGTYSVDVSDNCAEDCAALKSLDGKYVVGAKPTATVNNLGSMTIPESDYIVYQGNKNGDMPLSFVMQFLADQNAEDMETSPYADWYGDFVITFDGLEDGGFTADGCYLAGYYGDFGWVKVPVDGMKIENGVRYPVMLGVGMGQKYEYICSEVNDFRCAMYLTPEVLANHPNLTVKLELSVVDNSQGEDAARDALADNSLEFVNKVGETEYDAEDFVTGLSGSGTEADPFLIKSLDDLVLFRDSVNAGETKYNAPGVWVALAAGIDLATVDNWEPIGNWDYSFDANFDGNGHKIQNLKMSDTVAANGESYLGFFGITANNAIKDLVIENVTISSSGQIVAAAIAYPYYTTVDNITVCGNIAIKGGNYTAGVLAYTRLCQKASNLTVAGNEGSYITGAQAVGGIMADIQMNKGLIADYANFSVSGVTITGTKMVGGIAGIIATQTLAGATVKNVTLSCDDARVGQVAGAFGGTSTISGIVVESVTGATAIVGAAYDGSAPVEAKIGDTYYATFEAAVNAANEGNEIVLLAPVVIKNDFTLDKNVTISATHGSEYAMIRVENGATLTINKGKITYAAGGNNTGAAIWVEGALIQNSGIIEITGSWTLGFAVDVRPNAWGTAHTVPASFVMNGGKIVSSDTAVRVASNSSDSYAELGVSFTMNGGTIESNWDAIFVQHLYNGDLNVNLVDGTVTGENSALRIYGNAGSDIDMIITGGNYTGSIKVADAYMNSDAIVISGGTFTKAVPEEFCAEGFTPVKVEGGYSVGILPDAEVTNLGAITVGPGGYTADMYKTYDLIGGSGLQSAEVPYDLTLAMDFKAKDTAEAAAQNAFGNYTTDFFITMSGMSGESFVGNGCYLAGYYPSFNAWVKIPLDGFTVENGKVYPVITSAGFDFKYTDICGTVGQFICGIYLTPEVLAANPNLSVDLTLGLAENKDAALNAQFLKVDNYVYDADDLQPVTLPEVVITDIKSTLTDADPDLTFALNFAIKDVGNLSEEYLKKLFAKYGDYYTDYVLTISGLTDPNGSVKFNANGNGDGYLAGQYDAWSKSWVTVPFSDVTVKNGQSFYVMEYAAELMNKGGLRLTLKEIAEIVKNFDCGVYFTPEFLAANPNLKVDLELKVFTEDESGNKVGDISVATNTFDKDDFSVEAAKLDIRIVNGEPQIGFAGEGKLVLNAATALTGEWTKNVEYTAVENDGDDTKTWVTPKDGYYFFKGYIVR